MARRLVARRLSGVVATVQAPEGTPKVASGGK
jgi:hypothetical protein